MGTDRPQHQRGLLLAILWSFTLVGSMIGNNVASALMSEDVETLTISGLGAGTAFVLVSCIAGTFAACDAAAAVAFVPMTELSSRTHDVSRRRRFLTPVGWLTLGITVVSGGYGFVGVLISEHLPRLSTGTASA